MLRATRLYVADDVSWEEMHVVVGLVLGFRLSDMGDSVSDLEGSTASASASASASVLFTQDSTLAPFRWEALSLVPDVADLDDVPLMQRMEQDLPEDEGASDIVMETLAGIELYGRLKLSENAIVQRRILVCKWLYIQGFLNNLFPAVDQYIPNHLSTEYEDFLEGVVY
jgi:hypothetical protein